MSDFITVPHLPEAPVTLAAVRDLKEITTALRALGVRTLSPVANRVLPEETVEHTDMLLCHAGGAICFVSPEQTALADSLRTEGFTVYSSAPLGGAYPADVLLNVAVGRDFALGRFDCADKTLAEYLQNTGRTLLPVRQGYAKCSLCFVTENAFITEDPSVAAALEQRGASVLRIAPGDVYLSERHYGFFGGTSGKIAPDKLAVTGRLSAHRDGDRIRDFAASYGVEIVELTQGRITDVGSIIPLKEEQGFVDLKQKERTHALFPRL